MKAEQRSFLDLLSMPHTQFVLPPFQRVYSWTELECSDLLADVVRSGKANKPHFLGTFLYSELDNQTEQLRRLQVIDGQQRMTTMVLMVQAFIEQRREALALNLDGLHEAREPQTQQSLVEQPELQELQRIQELSEPQDLQNLTAKLLVCEDSDTQPKLLLTSNDRAMLSFILGVGEEPEDEASRLCDNLTFFRTEMARPSFDHKAFWRGCELLQVVAIELTGDDAPQEVFESLNAKGKRLALEDLVRNALLLDSSQGQDALELYETSWLPLENKVAELPEVSMDDILCAWIASRHGNKHLNSKSEVYPLFKGDLAKRFGGDFARLLANLQAYVVRFASNDEFRRDQMSETDRWLQGKPKHLISEHKRFGD